MIPLIMEHFSNFLGSAIKLGILLYFISNVIKLKQISALLILFCFIFIFNFNLDFGLGIINELVQLVYFPVCFFYFFIFFKNKNSLLLISQILSYTIIISSLFFLLGIFNENQLIIDQLEILSNKVENNSNNFFHFGFFEHPQAASKMYVLSVMIIMFKKKKSAIDYIILMLGIYLVYITYVRLAWLVLAMSFLLFLFHQNSKRYKILFFTFLFFSSSYIIPLIINRIFNFSDELTLTSLSSGRDLLILRSILFMQNISFMDLLFGNGFQLVMEEIGYTHNRLFEIVIFGGIVSFLLWIAIYRKIFIIVKPLLKRNYLLISILFLIINSMTFSHGFSPYLALLSSIAILSSRQK